METRSIVSRTISILLLVGTILGLYNVYADNVAVRALAERVACGGRPCTPKVTRESRTPLSQNFTFQTRLIEKGRIDREASVDVECQREWILLGDYRCTASGALP